MSEWTDGLRALVAKQYAKGAIDAQQRAVFVGFADFCERRDAFVPNEKYPVNLFGYGQVPAAAVSVEDNDVWIPIRELPGPAGVDFATVEQHWRDELADGDDADQIVFTNPDGDQWAISVLNFQGVMRLFLEHSPWSAEVAKALAPAFRRALVASGLGDALTARVGHLDADGTLTMTDQTVTLTELVTASGPPPSVEVIREHAMRGPAAAIADTSR